MVDADTRAVDEQLRRAAGRGECHKSGLALRCIATNVRAAARDADHAHAPVAQQRADLEPESAARAGDDGGGGHGTRCRTASPSEFAITSGDEARNDS